MPKVHRTGIFGVLICVTFAGYIYVNQNDLNTRQTMNTEIVNTFKGNQCVLNHRTETSVIQSLSALSAPHCTDNARCINEGVAIFSFHTFLSFDLGLLKYQRTAIKRFLNSGEIHFFVQVESSARCPAFEPHQDVSFHCVTVVGRNPSDSHADVLNWATDNILPAVWDRGATGVLYLDGDVIPIAHVDLAQYMASVKEGWSCLRQDRKDLIYCWPGFLLLSASLFRNVSGIDFHPMCNGDTGAWFDYQISIHPPAYVKHGTCNTTEPEVKRVWTDIRAHIGEVVTCYAMLEETKFTHLGRSTSLWAESAGLLPLGTIAHRMNILSGTSLDIPTEPRPGSKAKGRCPLNFTRYEPSSMEQKWFEHMRFSGNQPDAIDISVTKSSSSYCKFVQSQHSMILKWIREVEIMMSSGLVFLPEDSGVFSKLVYQNSCTGELHRRWIEPLFGILRDPRALCERHFFDADANEDREPWYEREFVLSHAHLLLEHFSEGLYDGNRDQNIMLDLGASSYLNGPGGVSQQYFQETYDSRKLSFDRVLMWEARPMSVSELWPLVPGKFFHNYQFINVPLTASFVDEKNPLRILRRITKTSDFVVLKLDIDNDDVEKELLSQIMESADLKSRLKEFMYEKHGSFEDAYQLLMGMRKYGIRAHAWP